MRVGFAGTRTRDSRFDVFEILGSEFDDERLTPPAEPLFIAFTVEDLEGARRQIVATGVEVGDVVRAHERSAILTEEVSGGSSSVHQRATHMSWSGCLNEPP